jgi:hypothetical protein
MSIDITRIISSFEINSNFGIALIILLLYFSLLILKNICTTPKKAKKIKKTQSIEDKIENKESDNLK